MATLLTKPVTRKCLSASDTAGRPLLITMDGGDVVRVRPSGKRTSYEVPIQAIYYLGLVNHLVMRQKEKMREYKIKQKAGTRCRKPRPVPRIFNPKLYEVLGAK